MNGKGEWGINLVPRLKVDDESEYRRVKMTDKTNKKDRDNTNETDTDRDQFNNQLSQRKRAKRDMQNHESKDQINVSLGLNKAKGNSLRVSNTIAESIKHDTIRRQIPSSTDMEPERAKMNLSSQKANQECQALITPRNSLQKRPSKAEKTPNLTSNDLR